MITQIMKKRLHRLGEKPACRQAGITKVAEIGLAVVLVLGLIGVGIVYAKEKAEAEIKKVETKEVIGEIISFSPMRNPKLIGVAYEKGDVGYDAFFEVDKDVKIVHKKSLDEIKLGDRVAVTYNEITQITEEGREQTKRVAKKIRFVKPATRKLRPEPGKTKESVDLEIKGLKGSE